MSRYERKAALRTRYAQVGAGRSGDARGVKLQPKAREKSTWVLETVWSADITPLRADINAHIYIMRRFPCGGRPLTPCPAEEEAVGEAAATSRPEGEKKMQWKEPVVMIRGNFVLDPGRERMRVRGGAAVTVLTVKLNIDFCKYQLLRRESIIFKHSQCFPPCVRQF